MPTGLPDKPSLEGIEPKWAERWERDGTYAFGRSATRDEIYAIDTPPPTVSGALHVGHVFSYTRKAILEDANCAVRCAERRIALAERGVEVRAPVRPGLCAECEYFRRVG